MAIKLITGLLALALAAVAAEPAAAAITTGQSGSSQLHPEGEG